MRRSIIGSAALVASIVCAPLHAASPAAASTDWYRAATADGADAVSLPCTEQESKVVVQGSVMAATCQHGLMSYVAKLGGPSVSGIGSYAEVLASARKDPSAGKIVETTVAGHRAFTVVRSAGEPVGYGEFVDVAPDRLVSLIAFEAEAEGKGQLSGAARAAAVADAERFIASLALSAK